MMNLSSNQKRKGHFKDYLALLASSDYENISFDSYSGGVSAIHKYHRFDKSIGPFGYSRGEYERIVTKTLRSIGAFILLDSESPIGKNIKTNDARLNGFTAEIKAVESFGRWSIRTKLYQVAKQNAEIAILFFPSVKLYSKERIIWGWERFLVDRDCESLHSIIAYVICIADGCILEILKPPR